MNPDQRALFGYLLSRQGAAEGYEAFCPNAAFVLHFKSLAA